MYRHPHFELLNVLEDGRQLHVRCKADGQMYLLSESLRGRKEWMAFTADLHGKIWDLVEVAAAEDLWDLSDALYALR